MGYLRKLDKTKYQCKIPLLTGDAPKFWTFFRKENTCCLPCDHYR